MAALAGSAPGLAARRLRFGFGLAPSSGVLLGKILPASAIIMAGNYAIKVAGMQGEVLHRLNPMGRLSPHHRPAAPVTALRGVAFRFRLDGNGQQHFNFIQCVWISASVPMAFTQAPSRALTTLALNMIFLASDTCIDPQGRLRPQRREARRLAHQFAMSCLLTAPAGGWVIPREVVADWVASRRLLSRGAVGRAAPATGTIGPV